MKKYPPLVISIKADIKALENCFAKITQRLRSSPMVKHDYDILEGDLRDAVYGFKDECDTL